MASAAFEELRAARREGRAPESAGLSFGDLVDTLNPLQHIPVVSEIYRGLTDDDISPAARVAGGGLYGGPIGVFASIVGLAITGTEEGLGDRIFASLIGTPEPKQEQVAAAQASEAIQEVAQPDARQQQIAAAIAPQAAATSRPAPPDGRPMPRLSPEAFQALVGSVSNPKQMQTANGDLASALDPEETEGTDSGALNTSNDLAGAMQQALDKYEALKSAQAVAAR
ncbi:MAG: hypothetical protein RH982_02940 [Parvibaculum sp.]